MNVAPAVMMMMVVSMNVTVTMLQDCLELFAYFDSDKDGVINYREFVSNVMQRQPTEVE